MVEERLASGRRGSLAVTAVICRRTAALVASSADGRYKDIIGQTGVSRMAG